MVFERLGHRRTAYVGTCEALPRMCSRHHRRVALDDGVEVAARAQVRNHPCDDGLVAELLDDLWRWQARQVDGGRGGGCHGRPVSRVCGRDGEGVALSNGSLQGAGFMERYVC